MSGNFKVGNFESLEAWRKATGQEMFKGKQVGMFTDPLLINPKHYKTINDCKNLSNLKNFTLQKNSPVIDAGIKVNELFESAVMKEDFFGTRLPQGKNFDIGACEYPGKEVSNNR